jgi:hypothetical protein
VPYWTHQDAIEEIAEAATKGAGAGEGRKGARRMV